MKSLIFILIFILFSTIAFAECNCFSKEINESIEKCNLLEDKAKNRSLWERIFIGGDLETGKEMRNVSETILNRIENCSCESEKQFKRCKTLGVMEEKRKGLFGWFRGFN